MARLCRPAALAVLILLAAGSLEGDKFLEKADEKFEQSATRAQESYAKSMGDAYQTRLKTYRTILAAATKGGDFERATAIKERIEELEAEEQEVAQLAPAKKKLKARPKNLVKFGGHEYALIEDPVPWQIAKERCEEMGGHLACGETRAEFEFLTGICKASRECVWLGATDEREEGKWLWITGKPMDTAGLVLDNDVGNAHYFAYHTQLGFQDSVGWRWFYICEWE